MKRLQITITVLSAMALALVVALVLVLRMPGGEQPVSTDPGPASPPASQTGKKLTKADKDKEEEPPEFHSDGNTSPAKDGDGTALSENLQKSGATGSIERRLPLLVNADHPIPENFQPDVTYITGSEYQFDRSAVGKLNQMMADAYGDGVILYPISAYRSQESQVRNFNRKLEENKAAGYSDEEAYAMTAQYIAIPGTSEHSLGLAVDLNSLEESFENTAQFQWLITHCAEYGFILRYPKDKEDITKIAYEPWHYRYVGEDHAAKIMEQGLCLEEYIAQAEQENN